MGTIIYCHLILESNKHLLKAPHSKLQVVLQEELHGDALTTRQAEPPLVQQETHPAEHTLCLGACACAAITGKRTEDVTY